MSLPKINLVVVGHKDHGKSTLIGRLLYESKAIPKQKLQEIKVELKNADKEFEFAFIMDSLEEERIGGLTIDIMHTPFKSKRYFYTIIDCPGHKEFIKKMLTGASQADAAVLVTSVKEGIQDQTKEHLFLVRTLGINQLVVVASKMDLDNYSEIKFRSFSLDLQEMLSSLGYSNVPVVPLSSFEGENITRRSSKMKWYHGKSLIEVLDETVKPPRPLSEKPLRCVVQDVYVNEEREVAICKVETGKLKVGMPIIVMPANQKGIIERVESLREGGDVNPGDSVGVILSGTSTPKRGNVLACTEKDLSPTKEFVAELIIFSDITLKEKQIVLIRVGTAQVKCKVQEIFEKIDAINLEVKEATSPLKEGEVGRILFRPVEQLYLEEFSSFPELGRFVVVGSKGAVAAGIVLEKK